MATEHGHDIIAKETNVFTYSEFLGNKRMFWWCEASRIVVVGMWTGGVLYTDSTYATTMTRHDQTMMPARPEEAINNLIDLV